MEDSLTRPAGRQLTHCSPSLSASPSTGVDGRVCRLGGIQLHVLYIKCCLPPTSPMQPPDGSALSEKGNVMSTGLQVLVAISHAAGHQDITITCHLIVPPTAAVAPAIKCYRLCYRRHSLAASTAANAKTLTVISSLESNILPLLPLPPTAPETPAPAPALPSVTSLPAKRTRKAVKR